MQLPFSFPALQRTYTIEITHLLVTRACNSVVECSLRMREVGGSIPLKSIYHFFSRSLSLAFLFVIVSLSQGTQGAQSMFFSCFPFMHLFIIFSGSPMIHSSSSRRLVSPSCTAVNTSQVHCCSIPAIANPHK